jgi:hypothetical protein
MERALPIPTDSAVRPQVTYADRCAVINVMRMVLLDLILLRDFGDAHELQMGRWLGRTVAQRRRFLENGYVHITRNVVYLCPNALNVLNYQEKTK